MGNVAPSDHILARAIEQADCEPPLIPQTLIDLMPTANEYLARLQALTLDFIPIEYALTQTTLGSVVDRVVTHLCTRDVHAASQTVQ